MSLRCICWVFDQLREGRGPSASSSLVLLKLADRANDDGICWPGKERIGDDVGLSEETVRKSIKSLEAVGLVIVERRKDSAGRDLPNLYHLPLNAHHLPQRGEGPDLTPRGQKSTYPPLQSGPETVKVNRKPIKAAAAPRVRGTTAVAAAASPVLIKDDQDQMRLDSLIKKLGDRAEELIQEAVARVKAGPAGKNLPFISNVEKATMELLSENKKKELLERSVAEVTTQQDPASLPTGPRPSLWEAIGRRSPV